VATAIAVVAWGVALAAVCLLLAARPPIDESLWFFLVDATVAAVYGTVAGVTLSRRQHPVPWIIAVTAIGGGLAAFGYAWLAYTFTHPGAPELAAVARLQSTAWVPGTMALFVVVPWLVRDHPLGWEAVGLAAGVVMVVLGFVQEIALDGRWDVTVYRTDIVLGLVTAAVVEWRHRHGPPAERNGLGWLALGTLVLSLSFVPLVLPAGWWDFPLATTPLMHRTSQALFPAAILVAVLRGRMWGLGLVVSRATLSGVLTMALLATYLLVSLLMTQLVPGDGGAHLVGAAVVAVAVQPARLWLGTRVNRLVYGAGAADPTRLVRRLGSQLGLSGTAEELLAGLARDIGTGMRLESVTMRAEGLPDIRWGEPSSETTYVPLQHRGEVVGELGVTTGRVARPSRSGAARRLRRRGGHCTGGRPSRPAGRGGAAPADPGPTRGAPGDPAGDPRRARSVAGRPAARPAGRPEPARPGRPGRRRAAHHAAARARPACRRGPHAVAQPAPAGAGRARPRTGARGAGRAASRGRARRRAGR
jgi:hypothetical protein